MEAFEMMSYKFKRRSFLRGVGGAVGLKIMLRNMEASAQGAKSPPRLLITHWPVGTVIPDFIPKPSTNPAIPSNVNSPILMPFATAGLGGDMTVLFGVTTSRLPTNGGGGHEGGTVVMMTGVGAPGTRAGETEGDDAFAGGPSMDQIFLKNVTALQQKGNKAANGFENAICDSRVDFAEVSTQCLSYGYATTSVTPVSGTIRVQNSPQLPTLRPLDLYTNLFGSFMAPTGGGLTAAMIKALKERKSVLDFSLREINQLETLAPSSERSKLEIHAQAIRDIETQISNQLNGMGTGTSNCMPPAMPPPVSGGAADKANHNDYGNPKTTTADDTLHAMIGQLHMGIIKAAFVCDIIRVATFQWSPGTNHVAFQNQFPGETGTIYMHHPESHKIGSPDTLVTGTGRNPIVGFLTNVQTWYNQQMANILAGWKTTTDGMGGNLFDNTIIPYVTEVAATGHEHVNMQAMLFGGKALGFKQGQYLGGQTIPTNVAAAGGINRPLNDLWLTVAQAFGLSTSSAPLNAEQFVKNTGGWTGPIAGLWAAP
jgi:hypothetical protein